MIAREKAMRLVLNLIRSAWQRLRGQASALRGLSTVLFASWVVLRVAWAAATVLVDAHHVAMAWQAWPDWLLVVSGLVVIVMHLPDDWRRLRRCLTEEVPRLIRSWFRGGGRRQ